MDYQKESNTESVLASGEETSSKEQINRTTKRNVAKKRRRPRTKALRCQLKDLDNLPLNCSHSLLERRCKQFGSVVNILLPQTKRIQRRIFQSSNVNSIQHSGFAFVQFASRTAAKRFCKRYQLNSRLKRTHHSHGHRHKKAKLLLNKQNLCNSEIGDELMKDCSDEKIGENKKEEFQPVPTQTDERATNPNSFIVPQIPSLTEISRTRMRSQSVAESIMSVDESGKETDLEEKQNENILQKGIKKHRRRRKPRKSATTNNKTSNHIFSLTSLFRHIQLMDAAELVKLETIK
uniref:RRM domain-containing protein n=1 Tax=Meloidogyne javanica TaxID=6303 RepID=A0A915LDK4_MELJA